jgi:hypothetical protein
MALAASGALALSEISTEFGGTAEPALSAYYRGAGRVPAIGSPNLAIPKSGAISFSDFLGSARTTIVDYEMIGGGGGGGHGVADGTSSGRAGSGGATNITVSARPIVSAAGGLGGLNGQAPRSGNNGAGTIYGRGGIGGSVNAAGSASPSSSYGAGGGGGGGDNPSTYDSSGAEGGGGAAGTRRTGMITAEYGTQVDVTTGARGPGAPAGYRGGGGALGYARLTWDGKSAVFTSSGTTMIN